LIVLYVGARNRFVVGPDAGSCPSRSTEANGMEDWSRGGCIVCAEDTSEGALELLGEAGRTGGGGSYAGNIVLACDITDTPLVSGASLE